MPAIKSKHLFPLDIPINADSAVLTARQGHWYENNGNPRICCHVKQDLGKLREAITAGSHSYGTHNKPTQPDQDYDALISINLPRPRQEARMTDCNRKEFVTINKPVRSECQSERGFFVTRSLLWVRWDADDIARRLPPRLHPSINTSSPWKFLSKVHLMISPQRLLLGEMVNVFRHTAGWDKKLINHNQEGCLWGRWQVVLTLRRRRWRLLGCYVCSRSGAVLKTCEAKLKWGIDFLKNGGATVSRLL